MFKFLAKNHSAYSLNTQKNWIPGYLIQIFKEMKKLKSFFILDRMERSNNFETSELWKSNGSTPHSYVFFIGRFSLSFTSGYRKSQPYNVHAIQEVKLYLIVLQGHVVLNKQVIADYLEHYPPLGPTDKVLFKALLWVCINLRQQKLFPKVK